MLSTVVFLHSVKSAYTESDVQGRVGLFY